MDNKFKKKNKIYYDLFKQAYLREGTDYKIKKFKDAIKSDVPFKERIAVVLYYKIGIKKERYRCRCIKAIKRLRHPVRMRRIFTSEELEEIYK